jgi:hypothetical protein
MRINSDGKDESFDAQTSARSKEIENPAARPAQHSG